MDASAEFLAAIIGPRIRRIRRGQELSQEALADYAEIHRTQISLLENGRRMPRVHTLICLAGALNVTPNDFLDGITWKPIVAIEGGLVVTPPKGEGIG